MNRAIRVVLVAAGVLVPSAALACMWDYDTLRQERSRFPDTLELITGKFLRHSPEFYEWRIKDRLRKLETDPSNLAYHDDLAVAYDKLGQHDKAIETILAKDKLKPGLYETEANLGTFLFHAGRMEESLPHISKAIRVNPNAHFGREKYQKALTQYVLRHDGGKKLPLAALPDPAPDSSRHPYDTKFRGFALFLRSDRDTRITADERQAAIKGVLGMMRFARHDAPILLEALANLLSDDGAVMIPDEDAKRMAARAYLKASYEVKDDAAKTAYRDLAASILEKQVGPRHQFDQVQEDFNRELADATKWYERLREDELSWIRDGKDPEAEFDKLYTDVPPLVNTDEWYRNPANWFIIAASACTGAFLAGVAFIVRWVLRRCRARANPKLV
jgi:tetratricopeptide (TPR) repeat protein